MRRRKLLSIILSLIMIMTMIPAGMIVNAAQNAESESGGMPFKDVKAGSWYYDSVQYAYDNNLMNGIESDRFDPDGDLSRAMFVTILGRLAGVDEAEYTGSSFSDVKTGQWYSPYIEWAAKNDITNGTGNGKFGINADVSREQMAVLITRYVKAADLDLPSVSDPVENFKDADKADSWAAEGIDLMRKSGLIKGDDNGNFAPLDSASRAEAAAVFERFCKALNTSSVSIGDIVSFGNYEQDNDTSNGKEPVEWMVIKEDTDRVLLLSRYALDCQPYNADEKNVTWEDCTLRGWLNTEFYDDAFSADEQKMILMTKISNPDFYGGYDSNDNWIDNNTGEGIAYLKYQVDGGNDTNDNVFLLDIDEAKDMLGYILRILRTKEGSIIYPGYPYMQVSCTEYAKARGVLPSDLFITIEDKECCCWWLRSPGISADNAARVYFIGNIDYYSVGDTQHAVRPAIWVDKEAFSS